MSDPLVRGDAVSCSRVGGAMRRDAARLLHRQQTLERSLRELRGARGPQAQVLRGSVGEQVGLLGLVAADLDRAGAALQRYATDLAQAMELARRAEAAVRAAGLELEGTRVVEAWGPTSAETAERRRALLPECQARVDRATSMVGRARAALQRHAAELVPAFAGVASALRAAPGPTPSPTPPPPEHAPPPLR